jgi:hypothetical protein
MTRPLMTMNGRYTDQAGGTWQTRRGQITGIMPSFVRGFPPPRHIGIYLPDNLVGVACRRFVG